MSTYDATVLLVTAYKLEVESRHERLVLDDPTKANISRVATILASAGQKFGLMVMGLYGNGKTTMLHAMQRVVNCLIQERTADTTLGRGVRIVNAKSVAVMGRDKRQMLENIMREPLLAIEDMGREPTESMEYGNVSNPVIDLLEYRYDEQLFTCVTTNLNKREIRAKYGARVADRLNEMMECVVFENASYRK